jgi:hypothetical protein
MKKLLAVQIVNNNEVQLIEESGWYYINWGEANQSGKAESRLETPKGRKPSINRVHKQFLEACKAAKYIKFSKL